MLSKLLTVDTREQSMRELKNMVMQNKTTSNLRLWLSVLTENRTKNTEYEALIVGFIVSQYKKGLLDPIDKVPTMEKTIFRVCELLSRSFKVLRVICRTKITMCSLHAKKPGYKSTNHVWMARRSRPKKLWFTTVCKL